MSDNQDFDPFEKAAQEAEAAMAGGGVVDDDAVDLDLDEELDDLFADADLDMEESEGEGTVRAHDAGDTYSNPLDVGIRDKMWVPIRLQGVEFKEKHTPRLSSNVCVAVKVVDGRKRIYVPFDQVETAIRAGATEKIGEYPLPYFLAEANHVTPEFGQRRFPYEVEVPALTIKTAFFKPQTSGRTGFKNENGRSLRMASGATKAGDPVNLKTMPEIAGRMNEKIVMARITLVTKTKSRPRLDDNNQPISVLFNPATSTMVTVFAPEDGSGYIVEGTGEIYASFVNVEEEVKRLQSGLDDEVKQLEAKVSEAADSDQAEAAQKALEAAMASLPKRLEDGTAEIKAAAAAFSQKEKFLVHHKDRVYAIRDSGENSGPLMEDYVQVTDYLDSKSPFLEVPEREIEVELLDGTVAQGTITWGTIGAIAKDKAPAVSVDVMLKSGDKDRVGETVTVVWFGTQWNEIAPKGDEGGEGGFDVFKGVKSL